ncbi:MAG: DUF2807 domain-containing protein [Cytophagales bacterium]|nr:DUF2807 domain-containing protein [Cytophagales bacterium]
MKNLFTISILIIILLTSCSEDRLCLSGDGNVLEQELELSAFDRVSLVGPVSLSITQGSNQSVIVRAESEMMENLDYKVSSGTLRIGFEENVNCFKTDHGVWVNVTLPTIEAVSVSGSSEIISNADLELDELTIQSSGIANVSLSGTVGKQVLDAEGVLNVSNFDLLSGITRIYISGSGNMDISCSDELDIDVDGSATVRYKGNPAISQNVSGSLDLIDMN